MEDIDYGQLIKIIENSTKANYQAIESKNKLIPNLCNLGAKKGDIAKLERSGEYYGIAVEVLKDLRPLATDKFIIRILKLLKNEDYVVPLDLVGATNIDQLLYILDQWLRTATIDYKNILRSHKSYPKLG